MELTAQCASDTAADGSRVAVTRDGEPVDVLLPNDAQIYLRCQRHLRALQGAEEHDLLLADEDVPIRARLLNQAVRAPMLELGVVVYGSGLLTTSRTNAPRWANRWGVSVRRLS